MTETRGSIAPGMTADMTVVKGVTDDLIDWSKAQVLMTICKGKIMFRR